MYSSWGKWSSIVSIRHVAIGITYNHAIQRSREERGLVPQAKHKDGGNVHSLMMHWYTCQIREKTIEEEEAQGEKRDNGSKITLDIHTTMVLLDEIAKTIT
jgi:hypothetical protein